MIEPLSSALFIYGTLIDPNIQRKLLGRTLAVRDAVLKGYHRFAITGEPYPAVAPKTGSLVLGKVCFDISDSLFRILDMYEEIELGMYLRIPVEIVIGTQVHCVQSYVAGPALRGKLGGSWEPSL
jgi:gamma-glutamylcyclotransferase (GGCT)/AIG2-like uncharacterized protein YtfP